MLTDGHYEANRRFSQNCEKRLKTGRSEEKLGIKLRHKREGGEQ
jgi:hypothetical protein